MKIKELEDYSWFPDLLRKYQMDFIGYMAYKVDLYTALFQGLKIQKYTVFDLCSGSGSPANYLGELTNKKVLLSDKYPQNENIQTVNVLDFPFDEDYFYTMFNAFHHFTTEEQNSIISKLQLSNSDFMIVEILQPTVIDFVKILFATTIGQLVLTPFIKPFSIMRVLFTYLLPINLVTVTVDGLISVINSKSKRQFEQQFTQSQKVDLSIIIALIPTSFFNKVLVISNKNHTS